MLARNEKEVSEGMDLIRGGDQEMKPEVPQT